MKMKNKSEWFYTDVGMYRDNIICKYSKWLIKPKDRQGRFVVYLFIYFFFQYDYFVVYSLYNTVYFFSSLKYNTQL